MGKIKKEEIWSIPNCMCYFRILLIPVFCIVYLNAESMKDYYLAAGIVLVSTITDLFDGKVARKFNMVTELGKFIDPLADKLTHAAIALCLCARYKRMVWLVALMAVKEGFMAVMGLVNLRRGKKLDGAKWYGKVCTATLFVILGVLVLIPEISPVIADGLILGEMVVMAVVLVLYAFEFREMAK
ncbi:MAG: CDP-alcohol phosphatidyltransferase family protein [Lachnospiraceae bacterium]|uniref:CDP-alcohol phosphatidyltransferase family protein n=1 Tax=Parablautia sp. Marseille-Q6255 TaxID=3039593 RepID=UPI0024BC75A8|nr:CDP-alcohol phosphatidyltransferase family protein [Parablautia sp. Marseille-Q6255]